MGMKLGKETGSLTNWMMSGYKKAPVVGEGATELCWTDRHAFTVVEVGKDGKSCVIVEDIATRTDGNGMSDCQSYEYTPNPNGRKRRLVFKWGAWRDTTQEFDAYNKPLVRNRYPKVNIIFGVRDKHYDYSF